MKFFLSILLFITLSFNINAQGSQGFNYQATVRNASGDLILNQNVNFKFNILQGSQTAAPSYTEIHDVQTDDLGQISLVIGKGAPSNGVFSDLDWSLGNYFLAIELDTGNGYVAMGTTQFYSVPYALYAENAGSARVDLDTIVTKESEKAVTGGGVFDALASVSINSINDPKFRETLGSSWENKGGGDFTVVNSQITSRASAGILRNFIASAKIGDNLILSGVYKIPTGFEDSVPKIVCRAVTETDIHDILTIEVPSKEEGTYKITDSITITDELVPSGEILGLQIDVYFQQANVTFFDPVVIVGAKADYYNALIPEQGEITTETEIYKNVELTNYALYPDAPILIVDSEGDLVSSTVNDTRIFDILSNTTINDSKLGKGFTFNIPNTANTSAFTFTWEIPNYMSFVVYKENIESGDKIGFSNSSGGFNWLDLSSLSVSGDAGFEITVVENKNNYIRLQCYNATGNREKLWFDFESTSDVTLYDLIVSPNAYNKYATYKHIYERNQSSLAGKRAMTWGDSNLSFGISYALKEQLGVNVSVNGAGGRRIGLNQGVDLTPITTSDHRTQTGDGNWLFSWYRKKAIKYAIDTYGSIDLMSFYTCYNDGSGDSWIKESGNYQYSWYNNIPEGTESDFTNYSVLSTDAIEAVEYNYPRLTDSESEQDIKYARFLALTSKEKKKIFSYRQTFAALIKEILEYNPNCLIHVNSLLYLPASDTDTPSVTDATWRDRKVKFDLINQAIKEISDWFGVYFNDQNKEVGYYIGNAQHHTPDGTHFTANIGYRIGFNTARKLLQQSLQLNYSSGTGTGPIVD